jgi:thiol-disulfide isomerase/thioredoxin
MRKILKGLLLLALLTLSISSTAAAPRKSKKTVKTPLSEVWNPVKTVFSTDEMSVNIQRVQFTDTCTTLFLQSLVQPHYWIKISPKAYIADEQGERYPLTRAVGLTPGKEFWMPDSGRYDFSLVFPALPQGTRSFDFVEDDTDANSWKFFGIHEANSPIDLHIPAGAKALPIKENETLPTTRYHFQSQPSKVTCKVYGYRPGMKMSLWLFYPRFDSEMPGDVTTPVADDGTATFSLNLNMPVAAQFGIEGQPYSYNLYLLPGQDVTFGLDLSHGEDIALFDFTGPLSRTHYEINNTCHPVRMQWANESDRPVDEMVGHSAEECLDILNQYLTEKKAAVDSTDWTDATKQLMRLEAESYFMMWRTHFADKWNYIFSVRGVKEAPVPPIAGQDYRRIPSLECLDADYAGFLGMLPTAEVVPGQLTVTNPYNRMLALMNVQLSNTRTLSAEEEALITDNDIKQRLALQVTEQQRLKQELAAKSHVFYGQYDDVAPADILSTILKKYEGKVVLVDIWATWCGPCRYGHQQMEPLKAELKDSDIVFVYLTGPTSPAKTWDQMIPDIPGEQYYLTQKQMDQIMSDNQSTGVPTYLLYDRQGQLTTKKIGFPGVEVMRAEIDKALGK